MDEQTQVKVAVLRERLEGERRVAAVPDVVARLNKLGARVLVERDAGLGSFNSNTSYEEAGAILVDDRAELYREADIVLCVHPPSPDDAKKLREGTLLAGFLAPQANPELVEVLRDRGVTGLAMELIPRASRAQAMDALSSQASIAGYKAALIAANALGKFLPMLTTPTGTIRPATVLVLGAGVAGLQAIATARRLGAVVEAYDVRAATKEQVESLGAKFVEAEIKAEAAGGYARELTEEEEALQRQTLAQHIARADAVIATAAVPGKPAPRIVSASMVDEMMPGAIIVDLAAESGGNCELTVPGETVTRAGVTIFGPTNVPSMLAVHASEMYAKNLLSLMPLLIRDGALAPDFDDQILICSVVTRGGEITHTPTRELVEGGSADGRPR